MSAATATITTIVAQASLVLNSLWAAPGAVPLRSAMRDLGDEPGLLAPQERVEPVHAELHERRGEGREQRLQERPGEERGARDGLVGAGPPLEGQREDRDPEAAHPRQDGEADPP